MPTKTKRSTKKTTKRTAKAATKTSAKTPKLSPASKDKPRTKGEIYRTLSEQTGLGRKEIVTVFDTMSRMIETDLKKGPGVFQIPGLMKVVRIKKPAQPARKNVPNPFRPGETMNVAAKPARNIVKVRPLKNLKSMV